MKQKLITAVTQINSASVGSNSLRNDCVGGGAYHVEGIKQL